jgi:hypothetical protein
LYADGIGTNACFYNPSDVSVDAKDNIYVADTFNQRIRKLTPMSGTMSCDVSLQRVVRHPKLLGPRPVSDDCELRFFD